MKLVFLLYVAEPLFDIFPLVYCCGELILLVSVESGAAALVLADGLRLTEPI